MRNSKIALLFLFFGLSIQSILACYKGCVVDKCSGQPLVGYPITYTEPYTPGGPFGGTTTFYTDEKGCFSINSVSKSHINIGGKLFSYNGVNCTELGNVGAYGVAGSLGVLNGGVFTPFWQGDPSDIRVNNSQVYACNTGIDYTHPNTLIFSYMAPNIDHSRYCMKIKVYQVNKQSDTLLFETGWNYFLDRNSSNHANSATLLLKKYPKGKYRFGVQIKCCDAMFEEESNQENIFGGTFIWNPPIQAGDVEFQWYGSPITEAVNMDGIKNGYHPNNGTIWQLGAASAGVRWVNNYTGSAALNKITYTLERDIKCEGNSIKTIKTETFFPVSGRQVDHLIFGDFPINYFIMGGPMINIGNGNIPNIFPIRYHYEDCFIFTVQVWGSPSCPPRIASGKFKIYDGDASARVIRVGGTESNVNLEVVGENAENANEGIEMNKFKSEKNGASLYPNPTKGILYLDRSNEAFSPTSIQLFDQNGRKMDTKFEDNHLDISHFPSGIYFLHSMHPTMGNKVEKIVKM